MKTDTKRIPEAKWEWFGNAGHFICADKCRFHLTTLVGKILVSTVGQMVTNVGGEYKDIGYGRKFETMTFKAGRRCKAPTCHCGLPRTNGCQLDFKGYNEAGAAAKGHLAMCRKVAKKKGRKK